MNEYQTMRARALELVKARILGTRKGLENRPNYQHSLRVCGRLEGDEAGQEVCLAGLLHDVIEDGGVSADELVEIGFSARVVELVRLSTHPVEIADSTERWVLMVAKLVLARDEDAWRIKLADLTDNMTESAGLLPENQSFMLEVKGPMFLRLTASYASLEACRGSLKTEMELRKARRIADADPARSKVDRFSDAFLDALNSVPREEQY